ncbi:MAG TPA: hypothetical protein VHT24_05250 [Pseudacidobacterium sp.]|jgi:hypothetical protein|nr:hypothetical protein [Pseudacidobacterium sp.]
MNNIPSQPRQQATQCDPTTRTLYGVGMALFMFGIFVPGAHTLMMVGLAFLAIFWMV